MENIFILAMKNITMSFFYVCMQNYQQRWQCPKVDETKTERLNDKVKKETFNMTW